MRGAEERLVRVAIADDHSIVRAGLRDYLEATGVGKVVGECASGVEAIDLLRNVPVDVLVLDLEMPGRSGLETIAALRARWPDIGILVLSGSPVEQYALKMLRLGAKGYLNKQCDPSEIASAIRAIAQGQRYLQAEVAELLTSSLVKPISTLPHEQLTNREFQILLKLARGQTRAEIAQELCLSIKTVCTYRSQISGKLALKTDSDLAYYAIKNGLID